MAAITSIAWTDRSWNPIRGCSIVSPGCHNCYAMKQAHRFNWRKDADEEVNGIPAEGPYYGLTKQTKAGPQWTGKIRLVEEALTEPLRWRKPQRVFVNSMSDLFHKAVPDEFIDRVFAVMAWSCQHTFQILTKRPERMRDYLAVDESRGRWVMAARAMGFDAFASNADPSWKNGGMSHVWLGVSCEDQQRADERIPLLLQTPAAVRFVSAEPLLGPIDLTDLKVQVRDQFGAFELPKYDALLCVVPHRLDWVIVGGESGPGARRCSAQWIRSIVRQCKAVGVPVFVKQLGTNIIDRNDAGFDGCTKRSWPIAIEERDAIEHDIYGFREEYQGADCRVRLIDRKGGDPSEWPADLRIRQFPEARP